MLEWILIGIITRYLMDSAQDGRPCECRKFIFIPYCLLMYIWDLLGFFPVGLPVRFKSSTHLFPLCLHELPNLILMPLNILRRRWTSEPHRSRIRPVCRHVSDPFGNLRRCLPGLRWPLGMYIISFEICVFHS